MPPRKRGAPKHAASKASILSYFARTDKEADVRKRAPNTNNNNGSGLKRKLSETRQNDVADTIVISSDDEDFENARSPSSIKRTKRSGSRTKVKKEVSQQEIKSEPCKEKNSGIFEREPVKICTTVKKETGEVGTNANDVRVHNFFNKKKSTNYLPFAVSVDNTISAEQTESTVCTADGRFGQAEQDNNRSNSSKSSTRLHGKIITTNAVGTNANPTEHDNCTRSPIANLGESVAENFCGQNAKVVGCDTCSGQTEGVNASCTIHLPTSVVSTGGETKSQASTLNDHNTSSTSNIQSQSSEDDAPEEKIAYYLLNFRQILDTVLSNDDDRSLFEGSDDITWLNKFNDLPLRAQKLYVRLYHRKLAWLCLEQITYLDIARDIQSVLDHLAEEGFLQSSEKSTGEELDLAEVLKMLTAPNLKELAKTCRINVNGRPKAQMVSDLQEMCKNQKSVIGGFFGKKNARNAVKSGLQHTVMKRARKLLGPCYKVAPYPRTVFNRVLLVFDVTRGIDDESECTLTGSQNAMGQGRHLQLSAILMAGMGRVQYPDCEVDRPTPIFRRRSDLLHYETAFQFQADVLACVEAGQWEVWPHVSIR